MLCTVDSGSFVHAINAEIELPNDKLIPPTEQERQIVAETACAGKLTKEGSVHVECEADGSKFTIGFDSMQVRTPILSVGQLVQDNKEVRFRRNGGFIQNLKSSKKIHSEYQVVHCMKHKIP